MQAASIAGFGGFGSISSIWDNIQDAARKVEHGASNALQAACGVATGIPPVNPYLVGAQLACMVGYPPTATTGGPGGTVATTTGAGVLSTLNQQMAAAQQQAALMSALGAKPWYKKPLPWVGIGAGVLAVGTGIVLVTRKKSSGRRR